MKINKLHNLGNPEVQYRIPKESLIIAILSQINPIPRIDTYLFKVHSEIVLALSEGLFPVGLRVKILKALLPSSILATWPDPLNLLAIRVFENRILRRIFGSKGDENGEWRRLHNEELCSLYR